MSRDEIEDLESSANWDFDNAEIVRRTKPARAVVSVSLRREDFETVSEAAERAGMRTSEFIRTAALEKVKPTAIFAPGVSSGSSGVILYRMEPSSITGVTPETLQDELHNPVTVG